jgi:hypothetical protein
MSLNEQKLLEGLRALAEDGPQEPPIHLQQKLVAEVRRSSRVRRWAAWGPIAAVAAGIAVVASLPLGRTHFTPAPPAASAELAMNEIASDFLPVPGSEGYPAMENAMVVRLELPVSSVRLMGFAVSGSAVEPVQADVLLGQDGLARGVRFVQ